jgi:hypothetical protein
MSAPTLPAVIRWEEPPPSGLRGQIGDRRPVRDYPAIARELRDQPHRWALVAECPARTGANVARRMRQGVTAGFRPAGAFEAEVRDTPEGSSVWARYVGSTS